MDHHPINAHNYDMPLVWRAMLAFLALPFVVAGVVPFVFLWPNSRHLPYGLPVIAIGVALLVWCVREFYSAGKGTLAPWDPPRHLVTSGPYRYSRNPMYVAVLMILAGWALSLDITSYRAPWQYALFMAIVFHLRVVLFEERWASEKFGAQWNDYAASVPRWLGRRRVG